MHNQGLLGKEHEGNRISGGLVALNRCLDLVSARAVGQLANGCRGRCRAQIEGLVLHRLIAPRPRTCVSGGRPDQDEAAPLIQKSLPGPGAEQEQVIGEPALLPAVDRSSLVRETWNCGSVERHDARLGLERGLEIVWFASVKVKC